MSKQLISKLGLIVYVTSAFTFTCKKTLTWSLVLTSPISFALGGSSVICASSAGGFTSCFILRWLSRSVWYVNFMSHTEQETCLYCGWIFKCVVKCDFCENGLLQTSHTNGLSFSWTDRMWMSVDVFVVNFFWQMSQLNSLIFVWPLKCLVRFPRVENAFSQTEQQNAVLLNVYIGVIRTWRFFVVWLLLIVFFLLVVFRRIVGFFVCLWRAVLSGGVDLGDYKIAPLFTPAMEDFLIHITLTPIIHVVTSCNIKTKLV